MVKSWRTKLPVSPTALVQKQRYVNKEKCSGRIISWFYEAEFKLFPLKRSDGVQYLKPRLKYFNSLPICEVNELPTKPLINRSDNGIADSIAKIIRIEVRPGKHEKLKPQQGKIIKDVDLVTQKVIWRYNFKPVRSVPKIPLKLIPYNCLNDLKWCYVDVYTGEAVIEDKSGKVIMKFFDAVNLVNFSKSDQKMLKCREIMYTDECREQALQYKRVLYVCLKNGICVGSSLPKIGRKRLKDKD
ncbi:hypothetical protein L1987_85751 [Smallanthus sonchifolius]|uniref:Uncharacterized protein n=1 Tax=Smallanthus sonchifolius TaxID=185202 RepID=A0ACB8XY01_9ASTR|nr:hypothetical protein L1987_85751 [Smallanthus sonchifolius]